MTTPEGRQHPRNTLLTASTMTQPDEATMKPALDPPLHRDFMSSAYREGVDGMVPSIANGPIWPVLEMNERRFT